MGTFWPFPISTFFRRIPWENDIPFFLLHFAAADHKPLPICPRSMLKSLCYKLGQKDCIVRAGGKRYDVSHSLMLHG